MGVSRTHLEGGWGAGTRGREVGGAEERQGIGRSEAAHQSEHASSGQAGPSAN